MSVYLKEFSTHSEYEQYINGSGAILPNVSICTTEGDVHYNPSTPPTPVETRVVAKFNVDDTSNPTQIISENADSPFSAIEIDGVAQQSVVSEYTFSTTGEHTVKYTLTDPTSIGDSAFYSCYSLTSVVIPDSVTSIGDSAFYDCTGLTSCTIGDSVTSIGDSAFTYCSSLTSINIPSGVTSIGNSAFNYCYGLTSINIPSGVTSIGESVFQECSSLTRLNSDVDGAFNIPSSVTSIGDSAFAYCSSLTSCTIGSGVTSIGNYTFQGCISLTSINIPNSVTSIGDSAFGCCPIEDEDTRNAIETINPYAFTCD